MADFIRVAELSELPAGGRLSVVFDERAVVVVRIGDEIYAVEDVCSHDGQPLTDGPVENHAIECPRHGARFDLKTGRPLCMPAVEPIQVFEVKIADEGVYLKAP